uniref:Calx-beta domain-containing protein n=1 Tax=Parasteatoda tepidariorum TaxID=114398 RepID=A0A2L2YFR1_PARTP
MKPEAIEFVFDCYTRGLQQSVTDDVDGVSYTRRQKVTGSMSGDPGFANNGVLSQMDFVVPQACAPQEPFHAPLEPQEEVLARNLGRQLSDMSDDFEMSGGRRVSISDDQPLVQFERRCKFVKSTDGHAEITIVRSGNSASELTVAWRTRGNTARADLHYVKAEGTISFLPNETQKVIKVQLLSGHEDNYINFKIDLYDSRLIRPYETINVNINDYENLSREEQLTIKHIIGARIPSIPHVINKLSENVTIETFKTALLCVCGNANSLPVEFRAAFELLKFALPFAPREHLMPFVTRYFETAPELTDMDIVQEDSSMAVAKEDSGSDTSENSMFNDSDVD